MIQLPLRQIRAAIYDRLREALETSPGSTVKVWSFVAHEKTTLPAVVLSEFSVAAERNKDSALLPVTTTIEFLERLEDAQDAEDRIADCMDAALEALMANPLELSDGYQEVEGMSDVEGATVNAAIRGEGEEAEIVLKGVIRYKVVLVRE